MGIEAEALSSKTSQLPNIAFEIPKHVIGTNTVDSMKSGLIFQNAALIDGMIERIEEEYGEKCVLIATGRYADIVAPLCKHKITLDKDLLLKGLIEVYYKNLKCSKLFEKYIQTHSINTKADLDELFQTRETQKSRIPNLFNKTEREVWYSTESFKKCGIKKIILLV